jgi:hypothetical protein
MIENQFDAVVKEKTLISTGVGISIIIVLTLMTVAGSYLYYIQSKDYGTQPVESFVVSEEIKAKVDEFLKADEEQRQLVSELESITMPAPEATDDIDASVYFAATRLATTSSSSDLATDTIGQVFYVGDSTFDEFLAQQTNRVKYDMLYSNLRTTIQRLQDTFKRPALYTRVAGVELMGSTTEEFVYPSSRVAEGYLTATIIATLDSTSEEVTMIVADDFARRGMLYGWYGQSDIDATKLFMEAYLAKLSLRENLINYAESVQSN